jgi:hypothetical protein
MLSLPPHFFHPFALKKGENDLKKEGILILKMKKGCFEKA